MKRSKIPLSFAGLLFSLSCLLPNNLPAQQKRLTNPLLAYTKFKELKSFRRAVEGYCDAQKKEGAADMIAVYFRSLSDGIWFGIGERERFSPASLLKVPVMMAVYKTAERDPTLLKKELPYALSPAGMPQTIRGREIMVPGRKYTVEELTAYMIRSSDNNASDVLWDWLGEKEVMRVFEDLGMYWEGVSPAEDFLSLRDYVRLLRVLYNASYLNEAFSEKALRLLVNAEFSSGLVAGVPPGVSVAHKFGERTFNDQGVLQLHDCGIVYYPNGAYLIGVMTRGKDFAKLAKVIKGLSALVYQEVDRQYKSPGSGHIAVED